MKDGLMFFLVAVAVSWIVFRLAAYALGRWLAAKQAVSFGRLGLLSVSDLRWQHALVLPVSSAPASPSGGAAAQAGDGQGGAAAGGAVPLSGTVSAVLTIRTLQLKIHWHVLRRWLRFSPSPAAAPTTAPPPSAANGQQAPPTEGAVGHLFTLVVDRVLLDVNVSESLAPYHVSAPARKPKRQGGTGLFHMVFGRQLRVLLLQFVVYTLVRWMDVLITRIGIRIAVSSLRPGLPPHTSVVETSHDMFHLWGLVVVPQAPPPPPADAASVASTPMSPRGRPMSPQPPPPMSPMSSTSSLAGSDLGSTLYGGGTSTLGAPSMPPSATRGTINVYATFSPALILIDRTPILTTLQRTVLTVAFALLRPVPSFKHPTVSLALSPIAVNVDPVTAFMDLHRGFITGLGGSGPSASSATATPPASPAPTSRASRRRRDRAHAAALAAASATAPTSVLDRKLPSMWPSSVALHAQQVSARVGGISSLITTASVSARFGSSLAESELHAALADVSTHLAGELVQSLAMLEMSVCPKDDAVASGEPPPSLRGGTRGLADAPKPLVFAELKLSGLEVSLREHVVASILERLAAPPPTPAQRDGSRTPPPTGSRHRHTLSQSMRSRLAGRRSGSGLLGPNAQSAASAATTLAHLLPRPVRKLLDEIDLELEFALVSPELTVYPLHSVGVFVSAEHAKLRAGVAAAPLIEADVEFTLGQLRTRVLGPPAKMAPAAAAAAAAAVEAGMPPELAHWVSASVEIVRVDALLTEADRFVAKRSATNVNGTGTPVDAGDASDAIRLDLLVEGHAHQPHLTLAASAGLVHAVADLAALATRGQQHAEPAGSGITSPLFSPTLHPLAAAAMGPLVALHSTAKFTVNRASCTVTAEPDPLNERSLAAEPGVEARVACVVVTHSGKRVLGAAGAAASAIAQAAPVEAATGPAAGIDTLNAFCVDEFVVEVDELVVTTAEPSGPGANASASAAWRRSTMSSLSSAAGTGTGGPAAVAGQIAFLSRVSLEHKVVDTAYQLASDVLPRIQRHVSTSVNIDDPVTLAVSIPLVLFAEHLARLAETATAGIRPSRDHAQVHKRMSITSIAGTRETAKRMQLVAGTANVHLQLPESTLLVLAFADARAVLEVQGPNVYAQLTVESITGRASQSAATVRAQSMYPSIFLRHGVPLNPVAALATAMGVPPTPPASQLSGGSGAPPVMFHLLSLTKLQVSLRRGIDVAASADEFRVSVPHNFYLRDVVENLATFVKVAKAGKPSTPSPPPTGAELPARVLVKKFQLTIDDDPFESRLNLIFRYGKDQQRSRLEREKLLADKLAAVHDLDHAPFWAELAAFHGREWVRIMKAAGDPAAAPPPPKLFVFTVGDIDALVTSPTLPLPTLAANCHIHDKDTPSDAEFDFSLARDVSLRFRSLLARIRDYPLPLIALPPSLDLQTFHMLHGLLILAEPVAPPASIFNHIVPIVKGGPLAAVRVRKALSPIKVYASMTWRIEAPLSIHWGAAVEPALADVSRVFDQFTDPSVDPSEPMPWWDKMRWLLHGKFDIEGEALLFHFLGSRNPYYSRFTQDGSHGVTVSAYGKRRIVPAGFLARDALGDGAAAEGNDAPVSHLEVPFKLSLSSANAAGVLSCAELEIAVVQPLINHKATTPRAAPSDRDDPSPPAPWDSGPHDKEVVMDLRGNVVLAMEPMFECLGSPRQSHHTVFPIAPEYVPAAAPTGVAHDSFARFRSERLSLAVRIRCENSADEGPGVPPRFGTFTFTPQAIDYAVDFVDFNVITKSTSVRRGALFPLSTPKYSAKKLSLFLSRFSLRVELAPVLVTLWHKDKAILSPNDAVGLRAVADRCTIDFYTARVRCHDTYLSPPPWYIDTSEIDFAGLELRCLILSDVSGSGSSPYELYEAQEQVRVRLANSHANLYVRSTPFFWSPRIAYCRNSDVDYGRESSFGRDVNRVQLRLLQEYLATAPRLSHAAAAAVQHRIDQLAHATSNLFCPEGTGGDQGDDDGDYVHSYVIHNSRLLWTAPVRNVIFKFIEMQEQASLLKYYTSNEALKIIRELGGLLEMREKEAADRSRRPSYAPPPAESLLQPRRHSRNGLAVTPAQLAPALQGLAAAESSSRRPSATLSVPELSVAQQPATESDRVILERLLSGPSSVFVSDEDLPHAAAAGRSGTAIGPEPPTPTSTAGGNTDTPPPLDQSVKSVLIQLINPQIKLVTVPLDDSPDGACFVTTENTVVTQHDVQHCGVLVKTVTSADITDANFAVAATPESAAHLGLGAAPYLATGAAPAWLPLECFFPSPPSAYDAGSGGTGGGEAARAVLPHGLTQVVHRGMLHVRHQRLNPALSANGATAGDAAAAAGASLGSLGQQQDGQHDTWQLEFTRFPLQCDALAFGILFNIASKLLIYREPAKTRRQEQLDLLMLAAQAEDIRGLLDSIVRLRADIAQLRLALHYDVSVLQDGQVDVDGTQRWTKLLARLMEMEEELLVVMESFKLMNNGPQRLRVKTAAAAADAVGADSPVLSSARSRVPSNATSASMGSPSLGRSSKRTGGGTAPHSRNASAASNAHPIYEYVFRATNVVWDMLQVESQAPFVQWSLAGVDFSLLEFSDQSRAFSLAIQQFTGWNRLPNPVYEEVANIFYPAAMGSSGAYPAAAAAVPQMLGMQWHELAPVAGIALVSNFEVSFAPIKLQMTYDLGKCLVNYIFPVRVVGGATGAPAGTALGSSTVPSSTSMTSLTTTQSARSVVGEYGAGTSLASSRRKRSRDLQRSGSTDALVQMKSRASRNTTFVHIRMPSVALCISYRGNKEKNIEDLHEFVLTLPTMEYHNKTWTWLEFLTQVRRDVFFAVLGHTGQLVKEKLFSSRRALPPAPPTTTSMSSNGAPFNLAPPPPSPAGGSAISRSVSSASTSIHASATSTGGTATPTSSSASSLSGAGTPVGRGSASASPYGSASLLTPPPSVVVAPAPAGAPPGSPGHVRSTSDDDPELAWGKGHKHVGNGPAARAAGKTSSLIGSLFRSSGMKKSESQGNMSDEELKRRMLFG
ncbi:Protein SABRE [Blastocladiella emersonii ATCC 22665]|nr:Protein SABRE [Blastocladiella emersonii ATCC 22665]